MSIFTPTLADLTPTAILALSKMLTEKVVNDARDQVEAGEYEIETVVHLDGTLVVEEDSETLQVNKLQPLVLLKVALNKLNGVTMDAVVQEAIELLKTPKSDPAYDLIQKDFKVFKNQTAAAYKRLAKATKQRVRGKVTFGGTITPVV